MFESVSYNFFAPRGLAAETLSRTHRCAKDLLLDGWQNGCTCPENSDSRKAVWVRILLHPPFLLGGSVYSDRKPSLLSNPTVTDGACLSASSKPMAKDISGWTFTGRNGVQGEPATGFESCSQMKHCPVNLPCLEKRQPPIRFGEV